MYDRNIIGITGKKINKERKFIINTISLCSTSATGRSIEYRYTYVTHRGPNVKFDMGPDCFLLYLRPDG